MNYLILRLHFCKNIQMKHKLLFSILFFISYSIYGQWENLTTGINDNLKGVVFFQNNGILAGENGLYYTTTGGVGAGSWTEFHITDNPAISDIYENTVFTHCYAKKTNTTNTGNVYACGYNTQNNQIVLFKLSVPSMVYELKYYGGLTGKLNKIDHSDPYDEYIAVGDNGVIIKFSDTNLFVLNSGVTENLNSVSFSASGTDFAFCSDTKIWNTNYDNSRLYNTVLKNTANCSNKDIFKASNSIYSVDAEDFTYSDMSWSGATEFCSNFYGPLDAKCISTDYTYLVGTNHGIYKGTRAANFQNSYLEWQPSSQNYSINEFWKQSGATYSYACGDNGVLLRTQNNGGSKKPYVKLEVNGTCRGGSVLLKAFTGSATSASWYVNGSLVGTGLSGPNYNFPVVGSYLISVTVQNSFGETSQDSKTITIVNPPTVDMPIVVSDLILCKAESIQIQISGSEPDVKYVLRKEGNPVSNFGESQTGNGGIIVLNSNLIDTTGAYYIEAVNTLANCTARFSGSIGITVEKTKADYHFDLINANVNEVVNYYNKSKEAQNFNWTVTSNSGVQNFGTEDIQTSFPLTGQTITSLDAWSNNNCHDLITKDGPNVLTLPTNQDDCFLLVNDGTDLPWPGYYNKDIANMRPTSDGFISCGAYNDEIFDSKFGVTYNLRNKKGCYLAKHDKNGVLKWMVYTVVTSGSATANSNSMSACVQDLEGNIYITGNSTSVFYDNAGNEINLGQPFGGQGSTFLIKLNSKGEYLWRIENRLLGFIGIDIDKDNNVILQTRLNSYSFTYQAQALYFNGVFVQNIGDAVTATDSNFGLVKIAPSGTVIWDTEIKNENVNGAEILGVQFDNSNNYYIALRYEQRVHFYSVGSNVATTLEGDGAYGGKTALVKFNEDGILQWKLRSRTVESDGTALYNDTTIPSDFFVDANGNTYISGSNECRGTFVATDYRHVFENTDSSTTQTTKGQYFVAKISPAGVCEWIRSAGNIYYGYGHNVTKVGNEIFVIGQYYNNGSPYVATAEFDSTDGRNYSLSIRKSDYFIAVYDETGNLRRIIVNGDNPDSLASPDFVDFFKGDGDYFYLAKNLRYYDGASGFVDFSQVIPPLNTIDGTILRLTEGCGIVKYDASTLGTHEIKDVSLVSLHPNPATNEFQVDLNQIYTDVELEIYDVYGKRIKTESFKNASSLKSNLAGNSGIYFVKVITDNKNVSWVKLLKK